MIPGILVIWLCSPTGFWQELRKQILRCNSIRLGYKDLHHFRQVNRTRRSVVQGLGWANEDFGRSTEWLTAGDTRLLTFRFVRCLCSRYSAFDAFGRGRVRRHLIFGNSKRQVHDSRSDAAVRYLGNCQCHRTEHGPGYSECR